MFACEEDPAIIAGRRANIDIDPGAKRSNRSIVEQLLAAQRGQNVDVPLSIAASI